MLSNEIIELVIKIVVYIFAFIICVIGVSAIDMGKITKNGISPNQKILLWLLIVFSMTFLVGSLFLIFLPNFNK